MTASTRTHRPLTIGNLLLDGFEETAARITRKFGARSCNTVVIVDDAGRAFAGREIVMRGEPPASHIVGTYAPGFTPEQIEDDLLCRQRELMASVQRTAA